MIAIDLKGMEVLRKNLEALGPRTQAAFEEGTIDQTVKLMNKAQKLVPVYTGQLRSSAYVDDKKTSTSRTLVFGYRAPYAAFVHEHPNGHVNEDGDPCGCYATIHRPRGGMKRNGQGYKWLEKAINAVGPDFMEVVARRVRSATMRATGDRGRRPGKPAPVGGGGSGSVVSMGSSSLSKVVKAVENLAKKGSKKK